MSQSPTTTPASRKSRRYVSAFFCAPPSLVEVPELDDEDRRLEGIQTEISADHTVVVLRFPPCPAFTRSLSARSSSSFTVTIPPSPAPPRFFEGKKLNIVMADGTRAAALVLRSDRLRAVFDDGEVVFFRDLHDRVHLRHLAVEVDRYDRPRSRVIAASIFADRC